jgi:hypothetical protein
MQFEFISNTNLVIVLLMGELGTFFVGTRIHEGGLPNRDYWETKRASGCPL